MDRFMSQAKGCELVGSELSIALNATGFGLRTETQGFRDGDTLDLGGHKLRFMETPDVYHSDSMMVVEETTGSVPIGPVSPAG
jgi:flavorubredoxin